MKSIVDILTPLQCRADCDFRPATFVPPLPASLVLPNDVAAFYGRWSEARLFGPDDPRYHLLPPPEFLQVGYAVCGERSPNPVQHSWFAFAHVRDGNYMAIDCNPSRLGLCYDVFHETAGDPSYCKVVARSLTEFLDSAVRNESVAWWLEDRFKGYGYAGSSGLGITEVG